MVLHGLAKLQAQFVEGWPSQKDLDLEGVLERFYQVASQRGVARMLAWLILSEQSLGSMTPSVLGPAAERMHAGRVRRAEKEGRPPPELEETLFAASFFAILVLGDSLFGPSVRRAIGLGSNADSMRRFRSWLTKVLERMEKASRSPRTPHTNYKRRRAKSPAVSHPLEHFLERVDIVAQPYQFSLLSMTIRNSRDRDAQASPCDGQVYIGGWFSYKVLKGNR
jgi:hypothetical protein